jgi:hypothetical protein
MTGRNDIGRTFEGTRKPCLGHSKLGCDPNIVLRFENKQVILSKGGKYEFR